MGDKLKVVLAGCGGIAGAWLGPIGKRDDIEMVGFVDLNEEAARNRAKEYGWDGAACGTDLAEVIRKSKAEAVFDCTIPEAHVKVVVTALENGCHVLGEKPMADTMENARKMVKASDKAGKLYAVIQNRRYLPQIIALRKFLDSGAIGEITTIQSDFFIGAHFGGFRDVMPHVLVLDMAIHTFDQARKISGADAEAVYCHDWNPKGSWYRDGASAVAVFNMTGGIVYVYHGSWCCEGNNTSWECDWRIIGTKGSVVWDGGEIFKAQKVIKSGGFKSEWEDMTIPVDDLPEGKQGHGGLLEDFVTAVHNGAEPQTICTDNIKSLAMVHAAIKSSENGAKVAVEL